MLYRVYSLDIERYAGLFLQAHTDPVALAGTWHASPRAWNRSAAIEADDINDVFAKGNNPDRWSDVRSVSVGDVIENHTTKVCWLVMPSGFLKVARPPGACPHAATLKPSECEFCADEAV